MGWLEDTVQYLRAGVPALGLVLTAVAVLILVVPGRVLAASLPNGFVQTTYGSGLTKPTAMEFAPDGRIFVAQQGKYHVSRAPGASVKLRFGGDSIRVMTLRGPQFGEVQVLIDGTLVDTVNLSAATVTRKRLRYKNLTGDAHTIVLQNVGVSPANRLPIDGFRVPQQFAIPASE